MSTWNPAYASEFVLHSFAGVVEESGKNLETRVSGGGGGGSHYGGVGYTAPVSISSTTTVHDQIFLTADDGRERSFQLQGFNVACRRGNHLSVFWGIPSGKERGPYVAVKNHTTGEAFFDDDALKKLFLNKPLLVVLAVLVPIASLVYLGAASMLVAPACWYFVWKRWSVANREVAEFRAHIERTAD